MDADNLHAKLDTSKELVQTSKDFNDFGIGRVGNAITSVFSFSSTSLIPSYDLTSLRDIYEIEVYSRVNRTWIFHGVFECYGQNIRINELESTIQSASIEFERVQDNEKLISNNGWKIDFTVVNIDSHGWSYCTSQSAKSGESVSKWNTSYRRRKWSHSKWNTGNKDVSR